MRFLDRLIVTRTNDFLHIRCPAKVNLFLKVTGKRSNGYHRVQNVMQTVTLFDELKAQKQRSGVTLACDQEELAKNVEENLAFRAASLFLTRGYGRGGVRLELKKNIPVAAGLGGGSSDGACCLLALNHLFKTGLRDDVLRSLAAELGSDAPFFIEGGIALCTERGDVVKQLPQAPPFSGIVAAPGAALNTGKMYSLLSREDQGGPGVEKMLNAITNGNLSRVCSALFNTFQKLALREVPEVGELTKKLRDLGSMGTVLCGSGPTVLGIFAQAKEADTAFRQLMADKNKKAAFAALISGF